MGATERLRRVAKVFIPAGLSQQYTGGKAEFEIDAKTVRGVIRSLEADFPGLGEAIEIDMAVAVDGEIFHDPLLEPVSSDSEVYFLPRIGGGLCVTAKPHPDKK